MESVYQSSRLALLSVSGRMPGRGHLLSGSLEGFGVMPRRGGRGELDSVAV